MCANRSDRDAIVVSSLPACPATLWQKRVKKRVNKNRFSFLTTHSHITYRIFSLSLPLSLCSLAIALTLPRYPLWFGSSLAYASTCLHYHCRLFFRRFRLVKECKTEKKTGSRNWKRTNESLVCASAYLDTRCRCRTLDASFNHQSVYVCVFVWKCVHIR